MLEFMKSVWEYVYSHGEEVLTTLFGVAAVVVSLMTRFASIKQTKTANTLNTTIGNAKQVVDSVESTEKAVESNTERVNDLTTKVEKLYDTASTTLTMLTSTVEALQTVYNYSIRDEETRTTANNLLTEAKYAANTKRADIVEQLEKLKAENDKLTAQLSASVEQVKKSLAVDEKKAKNVVIRG